MQLGGASLSTSAAGRWMGFVPTSESQTEDRSSSLLPHLEGIQSLDTAPLMRTLSASGHPDVPRPQITIVPQSYWGDSIRSHEPQGLQSSSGGKYAHPAAPFPLPGFSGDAV